MTDARLLGRSLIRAGAFSFAGKGIGFLVPIAVAGWFGVGRETDTFFIAYAFVFFAVGVWGQGIEVAALPHIVRWRHSTEIDVASEIQWAHRALFIAAVASTLALSAVFGGVILRSVGSAVSRGTAWICFLLLLPMFVAAGAAGLSAAALTAAGRYSLPALSQGFRAVGVLAAALLLRRQFGVFSLAIGYSAGELLRFVVLEAYRRSKQPKQNERVSFVYSAPGTAARAAWSSSVWPQFTALALVHAGPLVERWAAAHSGTGAISQIDYGLRLFAIPATVFDTSMAAVLLSHWSHTVRERGVGTLHASTVRVVTAAFCVASAISVVCIWQRHTIVEFLLLRGKFDAANAAVVSQIFTILMVGFPLGMAALVFERAFMAVHRTRSLMGIAGAKLAVRTIVAITLGAKFGVLGIAAAQPASSAVDLLLQTVLWRRGKSARDATT